MERPFRYIRQDFFLARTFRNIDDLNAQFEVWRSEIANPRVHATTGRVVDEAFAEDRPHLTALPALPYSAVLTVERRVSHEGMVSVDGNHYSVPDTTRKRVLALLDRLLHHAVVLQIEGASYRLRSHADLIPEHVRSKAPTSPPPPPKRRGRPPKDRNRAANP